MNSSPRSEDTIPWTLLNALEDKLEETREKEPNLTREQVAGIVLLHVDKFVDHWIKLRGI